MLYETTSGSLKHFLHIILSFLLISTIHCRYLNFFRMKNWQHCFPDFVGVRVKPPPLTCTSSGACWSRNWQNFFTKGNDSTLHFLPRWKKNSTCINMYVLYIFFYKRRGFNITLTTNLFVQDERSQGFKLRRTHFPLGWNTTMFDYKDSPWTELENKYKLVIIFNEEAYITKSFSIAGGWCQN